MTQTQQPEALRLARKFEEVGFIGDHRFAKDHWCRQAAAELRRQHARIAELEAVLSAMGEKGNPVEHFRNAAATAPAHPAEGVPVQVVQPSDALIEAVDAWFADNTGLGGCSDKDVAELAAIFATQPAAQGLEADLTDEQIDEAFNQMPDGAAGFLKSWGYRQFARAVLAAQAKHGEAQQ